MSKYDPLKRHLIRQRGDEAPMTFAEVEQVLGFRLPDSARSYAPWWSNHVGTHVNAAAWRNAGWKTAQVNVGEERVTFVRDAGESPAAQSSRPRPDPGGPLGPIPNLSESALRMIDDWAEETGADRASAAAAILEAVAATRRRQMLSGLPVATMPTGHDSTDLIREDRERG